MWKNQKEEENEVKKKHSWKLYLPWHLFSKYIKAIAQ